MNSLNKKIILKNIDETKKFAQDLAKTLKPNDTLCLFGDLGVGKSVIARAIGKFFNINDSLISPTFNILKTYKIKNNLIKKINHFDLYRIKSIDELSNIGFEDYIYENNVLNIIEWPEIAIQILPKDIKKLKINRIDENRREVILFNE